MAPPVEPPGVQLTSVQSAGTAAPAATAGPVALAPPPQAVARAAVQLAEKWAAELTRVGDLSGVNLRGALWFVQPDVSRVTGDLSRGAPDSKLTADTARLVSDWLKRGGQAIQALRGGLFQNTERAITQINATLTQYGVPSPEVHGAIREVNTTLRTFAAQWKSATGGIPAGWFELEELQRALNYSMAKVTYAALVDIKAHPEHAQALQVASIDLTRSTKQLMMGMSLSDSLAKSSMQEMVQLGLYPPPAQQPQAQAA